MVVGVIVGVGAEGESVLRPDCLPSGGSFANVLRSGGENLVKERQEQAWNLCDKC